MQHAVPVLFLSCSGFRSQLGAPKLTQCDASQAALHHRPDQPLLVLSVVENRGSLRLSYVEIGTDVENRRSIEQSIVYNLDSMKSHSFFECMSAANEIRTV